MESERERNSRLYPWFTEIVNRYPRADVKAAWITDAETGEILAGRVPADEYKHVEIDADQYFALRDMAVYFGKKPKDSDNDAVHPTKPTGHRKDNRKSVKKR